jgi:2-dehydro-3-deoxyphosphogluconate aldolase / (4S)-4-hydroxy-2-oxoglutarate aldolase
MDQKILPLFYHDDPEICVELIQALYAAGIRSVEFTNRGVNALENFKIMVAAKNATMPDLKLGIGTILSQDDAEKFIAAQADFLISPCFEPNVSRIAHAHNMTWIPGCMTPTEINTARLAGWTTVKIFPGNVLGMGFLEAIKPLFPTMKYIVTGGVDASVENISAWLNAGAKSVGLGSKLINATIIKNKDYKALTAKTNELLK